MEDAVLLLPIAILGGLMILIHITKAIYDYVSGDNDTLMIERATKYKKIISPTFNENKHDNFVGVEIECIRTETGFKDSTLSSFNFSEGSDASIKEGYGSGVEYKSYPSQGDKLLEMVNGFCKELNETKHKVNKSCGLHIHIETLPEIELLKKLYCFYSKYEGLFFAMLPQSRQENQYCEKFKRLDKYNYEDVLKINTIDEFKKLFYEKNRFYPTKEHSYKKRYCWMNFHSMFYRGTLEIRAHSGTVSGDKINKWIMIHLAIRDYLEKHSINTISKMEVSKRTFLKLFSKDLQNYIKERWKVFPEVAEDNFREYK